MLRCQRPATEDRSLQIYLEEGRDGALGIQPPPECRPPRKIRKGEAETVAWPAVGGTGGDREECFLAPGHVQRRRLGWTRAIFCSTRFSATCWFGGNARFWSAVPWTSGQGGGKVSAIMPLPLPGGRPPCAMRRACLGRDGFEFTDHISSLPQSFWATILSPSPTRGGCCCSGWR